MDLGTDFLGNFLSLKTFRGILLKHSAKLTLAFYNERAHLEGVSGEEQGPYLRRAGLLWSLLPPTSRVTGINGAF